MNIRKIALIAAATFLSSSKSSLKVIIDLYWLSYRGIVEY